MKQERLLKLAGIVTEGVMDDESNPDQLIGITLQHVIDMLQDVAKKGTASNPERADGIIKKCREHLINAKDLHIKEAAKRA